MSNLIFNVKPQVPQPAPLPDLSKPTIRNNINALKLYFPTAVMGAIDEAAIIAAFGINQARRSIPQMPADTQFNVPNNYQPDNAENVDVSQMFGDLINTPVYGTLTLGNTDPNKVNGNQYTGIDNNIYTFNNLVLPIALVELSQKSIIGKTRITGRPGTVKQYITLDDWDIKISSVVTYPADQAPKDFMAALWKIKQAAVSLPVTNYFLNAFGVTYLVIDDINPVQEEGKYSSLAFTISATSDNPITQFLP